MKNNFDFELMLGDCLVEMDRIESKSVDMILCDLPYGVTNNKKDIPIPFDPLWKQYKRILKDNGVIQLFGQGLFFVNLILSNAKMFRYDIVWDKVLVSGFLNAKKMPLRRHEQIAVFYKKTPTYNPQFTQGKPLHGKGISYKEKEMVNQNYGKFKPTEDARRGCTDKYPTSIIKCSKPHPSQAKHATQKPIELLENLILTYTNPGDIVLDNCMGSGGCGIAAIRNGRKFIGIEIDPIIFNQASDDIIEFCRNMEKEAAIC